VQHVNSALICPHYQLPLDLNYATELLLLMAAYTLQLAVVNA